MDGILITQSKQKALARTEKKQNANSVHNAEGKDTVTQMSAQDNHSAAEDSTMKGEAEDREGKFLNAKLQVRSSPSQATGNHRGALNGLVYETITTFSTKVGIDTKDE